MAKAYELNVLSTGDCVSRGFSLFSKNITRMMTWVGFSWLTPMLVLMSLGFAMFDPYAMNARDINYDPSIWATTDYAMFHWMLYISGVILFFGVTYGGLVYMASRYYVGDDPQLIEIIRAVFRRAGHVVMTGQLYLLFAVAVIGGAYSIAVLLYMSGEESGGVLVGMFLSTPGSILLLWLVMGRYALSPVSVVCDETSAFDSFSRSPDLTKGYRGRAFALILMSLFIVGGPFNSGLMSLGGLLIKGMLEGADKHLLGDALRLCWFAVCIPIMVTPFVVMYFDMICRKEGYDLAVMAGNFGISQEQMNAFQMDTGLGYVPVGYRRNRPGARKMIPPAIPQQQAQQQGWPQQQGQQQARPMRSSRPQPGWQNAGPPPQPPTPRNRRPR
ncbi:hypothetical protein OAU50_06530 [Planctomycetota bacterium]|nr:hypothetical protein [Planctomycetota bacterium]